MFDVMYDICRSREFATKMTAARPFESAQALLAAAAEHFRALSGEEWLLAFAAHPKLGDKTAPAREAKEQSGTASANEDQLALLARLNEEYHAKNGFVFLLCATGVSIGDMLQHIERRVANTKEEEMSIAAEEKLKIINIRLGKFLESLAQ
jgi:2-oxo-4-hydroxy-4-carboxy-5-ureidoimidazoline decarboxylase